MLHVNMIEDGRGDLVAVLYACSQGHADLLEFPQPSAWPGGMESDSCEYCAFCGDVVIVGIECGCPEHDEDDLVSQDLNH